MMDWQTVESLRIETERLRSVELEARRAAATKEQEYRAALWEWIEVIEKEKVNG